MASVKQILEAILIKLTEVEAEIERIEECLEHIDAVETEERAIQKEHWG